MANSTEILKMLYARYKSIAKTKKEGSVAGVSSNEIMKILNIREKTNKVCRICFMEGSVNVFEINSSFGDITEALTNILGIKVSINDSYPKYLCQPCYVLLEGAILFRKIAQQSDRQLKKLDERFRDFDDCTEAQNKIIDHGVRSNKQHKEPKKENLQDINNHSETNNDNETVSENDVHKLTMNKQLLEPKVEPEIYKFVKQKEILYECTECVLNFNTQKECIEHDKLLHPDKIHLASNKKEPRRIMNRYKEKTVRCKHCNLKFKSHEEYNGHIQTAEHRKQPCAICGKTYGPKYIEKHMLVHQSEIAFVCDICGKNFKRKGELNRHSVIHVDVLPFKCPLCPYKGRRNCDLKIHIRTHTGEKPYQCNLCAQRFINKSNLSSHMKCHKVEREFKCEECSKEYYRKQELKNHYKAVHVGLKEHRCQHCNKVYSYRKHLLHHQRKAHNTEKLRSGKMPIYLKIESMKQQEETQ